MTPSPDGTPPPPRWALVLAFILLYFSWGTTYLAIKEGVRTLPPGLFGGVRVACAGLILLAALRLWGISTAITRRELAWTWMVGILLFVGGNGLLTAAERTVPSGVAAVLVSTTPLWLALLEWLWPWGERLTGRGWLGILVGAAGVGLLLGRKLNSVSELVGDLGLLMVLGSAFSWSLGSFALRHRQPRMHHLTAAAYQMLLGGGSMVVLGLLMGEASRLAPEHLTRSAVFAFFYLLVVGSLVGYLSFNWLLGHVSATLVGTYAYVNPAVALVVGAVLGGESLTPLLAGSLAVILVGVALVRSGQARPQPPHPSADRAMNPSPQTLSPTCRG